MKVILLISILVLLLSVRFIQYFQTQNQFNVGKQVEFSHTLFEDPKTYYNGQTFRWNQLPVEVALHPKLSYGSIITVKGVIQEKEITFKGKDETQNIKRKIIYVKSTQLRLVKNWTSPILSVLKNVRQHLKDTFKSMLPDPYSGLLIGIVFGIKDIPQSFYEKLQVTGVLHIIAASGMNVTMVGAFILAIVSRYVKRQIALFITILGIILYATLSGLEPSIVRASIMAVFAYSAQALGGKNYSYLALFFAASIMLIKSPNLLFDIGFQLSVSATWGILSIKPLLDEFMKHIKGISFIRDDLNTTVAAQLATVPIMLFAFGSYSLLSVPVNLLVLWTIPYLMILGGVGALVSFVSKILAIPFLYLSYPLLLYFREVIHVSSHFSIPVELMSLPISIIIGYYLLLFSTILFLSQKRKDQSL